MKKDHKIIIAGGGTGGHVFPAIAIARALERKEPRVKLLFVGAKGKMEMEKVPEAGYEIKGLDIAGMNRSSFWKNISLPFKVLKSLVQARKIIKNFQPDVAVGVGGYASFPILYSAQRKGISTVIQEQNSFAGKTNVILGKKARKICVGSRNMQRFFPKEKLVLTGNPIREDIVKRKISKSEALKSFGLKENKKTVFVVGGSQGARSINEALLSHIEEMAEVNIQVIWQTGKSSYEKVLKATENDYPWIKPFKFLKEIELAYAAVDVIVSRAGAIALAELSVVGKPVIFVPLPHAAENHQVKNALSFVDAGAALLVKDEEANGLLVEKIKSLLKDENQQENLAKNIKALAITDADDRIAEEILKVV